MQCIWAVLYCHLWPVWLHHIFPHYLINNDTIFRKKVIKCRMCVLIFSTTISETFLNLSKIQRDIIINVETSSSKMPIILSQILIKLEFSRQIFEKELEYRIS
jgi:hypothetical protein